MKCGVVEAGVEKDHRKEASSNYWVLWRFLFKSPRNNGIWKYHKMRGGAERGPPLPTRQAQLLPSLRFPAPSAIVGLPRGSQCGMGRSWGGHGLTRNTETILLCPPVPSCQWGYCGKGKMTHRLGTSRKSKAVSVTFSEHVFRSSRQEDGSWPVGGWRNRNHMFQPPPTPHLPSPKQLVSCDKNNPSGATSSDVEHLSARMVSVTWQPCAMISLWAFPILQNSTASCNWFGRFVKTNWSSDISDINIWMYSPKHLKDRGCLFQLIQFLFQVKNLSLAKGQLSWWGRVVSPQPLDYNIKSENCDTSLLNFFTPCGGFDSSPQLKSP